MKWEILKQRVRDWVWENPKLARNILLVAFILGGIALTLCLLA